MLHCAYGPASAKLRERSTGQVGIAFDGRTWAYTWPAPNRGPHTLRAFLRRISLPYAADKMQADRCFNAARAPAKARDILLEDRRAGRLPKEAARDLYDEFAVTNERAWDAFLAGLYRAGVPDVWEYGAPRTVDPAFALAWAAVVAHLEAAAGRAAVDAPVPT